MCSVGGTEFDDDNAASEMVQSTHKLLDESDICRKCKTNSAKVILRGKDCYCKECFIIYFIHKFRSTIGKSKEIKHDDQILISYSAGANSTALLKLIRQGLNEDTSKKIKFYPHVLYIDESILPTSIPEIEKVYDEVAKLNFPFSFINFQEVLKDESEELSLTTIKENEGKHQINSTVSIGPNYSNEFTDLVERLRSQTSRDDLIRHLRMELICRCAKQLGFQKVFLGENGTELSVQILSNVALGRGSQLADNVQFKSHHFGVEVYRPLREIFDDEIKFYISSENICVLRQDLNSSRSSRPSIVSCTRDFINGLQKEYPSTVSTVFRTGGKLVNGPSGGSVPRAEGKIVNGPSSGFVPATRAEGKLVNGPSSGSVPATREGEFNHAVNGTKSNGTRNAEKELEKENELCLFCGLRRDTVNPKDSSALNSIRLSKKLTCSQPPGSKGGNQPPGSEEGSQPPRSKEGTSLEVKEDESDCTHDELFKNFCYGCSNLIREMETLDFYPQRIRTKIRQKQSYEQLKPLIQEFLIED